MNIWYSYFLNSCMWTFSYLPKGDPMWKIASTSESSLCRQTIFFQPLKKICSTLSIIIYSNYFLFMLQLACFHIVSFLHIHILPALKDPCVCTHAQVHKHINTAKDTKTTQHAQAYQHSWRFYLMPPFHTHARTHTTPFTPNSQTYL